MDFTLTEEQRDIESLALQILIDHSTDDRLAALEAAGGDHDDELLRVLAEAGLLGIAIGPEDGGSGLGLIETALLLRAVGATVARVPVFSAVVLGSLPISRFGNDAQRARWLPGIVDGSALVTAGLEEAGGAEPYAPETTAVPVAAGGWLLSGTKLAVPDVSSAVRVLVSASTPDGQVVLALVDPAADGVVLREQIDTTRQRTWMLELAEVSVTEAEVLAGPDEGADALRWILETATALLCAIQLGAAETALTATARWVTDRHQFGRPLATFQAVSLRAADAYIALEANRLTMWQAVWRLSQDLPSTAEVAMAKWWAAEAGTVVMTTAHRLQAGVGVDMTSPLPRFTLLSRQIEYTLGAGRRQLRLLGAAIADQVAEPAAVR